MDDSNEFLIPRINSLSLEDLPDHQQWYSGRILHSTQPPNDQACWKVRPSSHSLKSIRNNSNHLDSLVNFSPPKAFEIHYPISPPPTNSEPKRSVPLPAFGATADTGSISMPFVRPFGGLLDSPLVYKHIGLHGHHALISPPPTLPTTTRTLPPTDSPHLRLISGHEDFLAEREDCHDDHDNRPHDSDDFQPSLLGLPSPSSQPNDLYGSLRIPPCSSQSNPLLSPISPDWSVARMPSDTSSSSYAYYSTVDEEPGSSSILLQHRPDITEESIHRPELSSTRGYDAPLSPSSPFYSRPILPPLDMSSLLDTPPPSSWELSDDNSPPSPPHTSSAPRHPFIRDHSASFTDGHDPRRPYTQKRSYLRNPQTSPSSPPDPIDQEDLSILSPFDYGYDGKPFKVFASIPEDDDMDIAEDDQLQEILLSTPEPPSPQPLAPLDPPPISDELAAHEFAPGQMPWSPSLRGFSDLPDLSDDEGEDYRRSRSTSSSSSSSSSSTTDSSIFMDDLDYLTESPKPSLLSLPGAETDDDLIPLDTPFSSLPGGSKRGGNPFFEAPVYEEPTFWSPALDSNPFFGGSSSKTSSGSNSLHRPKKSPLRAHSPVSAHAGPSTYDFHSSTPGPLSTRSYLPHHPPHSRPSPSRRRSLLLVDEDMEDDPSLSSDTGADSEESGDLLSLPPWRSSLSGGRERDEEDAVIRQADASSDPELRRLSELMKKALKAERDARDAETKVLSGGSVGYPAGGLWDVSLPTSSVLGHGRPSSTITRGAGIDMAARREARKAKKKARDRAREIGTMMKLKMAPSTTSSRSSSSSLASSPGSPLPSRLGLATDVDETSPEVPARNSKRRHRTLGEAKSMNQLVAKMMLRRHDTYRTLANRKTPLLPGRKYASSPLVRTQDLPPVEGVESGFVAYAGEGAGHSDDDAEMEDGQLEDIEMHGDGSDPWTMQQD